MKRQVPLLLCRLHELAPLKPAEDGNDDVKAIEAGLEGNILIEIKATGEHIDDNPNKPLFKILVGEGPNADNAQCGGKAVNHGNSGVGKCSEEPVHHAPDTKDKQCPWEYKTGREMTDGQGLF